MKKVLWIACLLCMIPFLGIAQNRAGLAMQDEAAGFGQAPVSKELPATFQLKNGTRAGDTIGDFHLMFVPDQNSNYGRYYHITLVGSTAYAKVVRRYNDWYYSAADYYYNAEENSTAPEEPVWAYANDYTKGFTNLNFVTGAESPSATPISLSMNDITYDYNHGYMVGTKFGYIYQLTLTNSQGVSGAVASVMYDYHAHDGLKPAAIAADLDGTLYFVSLSPDGDQPSSLYKMVVKEDGTYDDPEEIGSLEWPAYHIQTMAFDHNTRRLFWWACDINGNTMLKEIDKETALCIDYIPQTEDEEYQPGTQTEMAGMIFEFEYRDYTVTCINTEGTLTLDNGQTVNQYKPGKDVHVAVTAGPCQTLDHLVILNANDHTDTIAVIYNDELGDNPETTAVETNVATFAMPACDVDVDAVWSGNEHNITINVTPSSMNSQITTNPAGTAECGNPVVINYGHPVGYMLSNNTLKAKKNGNQNISLGAYNNYSTSFTMPDANVTITGTYVTIAVAQVDDICQYKPLAETLADIPAFTVSNTTQNPASSYTLEYWFKKPGGSWTKFTEADMMNGDKFNKAGTWQYYVKVHNMYGWFQTATKSFTVTAAPKSIALEGGQYNCDGDSIVLNVVATPADATLTGLFVWKKDGVELITTDVPQLVINPCTTTDAGYYAVEFAPGAQQEVEESSCTLADSLYKVNVSTLPNKPEIGLQDGGEDVCFNSSATLVWKNGVLDPDAYIMQWYTIAYVDSLSDTVWTPIPGANAQIYTTPALDTVAPFVYGLSIRYQGVNVLCHSESDPDTVWVREQEVVEIMGDLETCKGFIPAESPYVDESYTNVIWKFNGVKVLENSNVLDFENLPELGTWLQQVDTLVLDVEAQNSESTCTAYGTYDFIVKPLPEVIITNNITDDTAHYDDKPVLTINICIGDKVVLTASGADEYRWGDAKDDEEPVAGPVSEMTYWPEVSTTYSVDGYSEETGCWNRTSIRVIVNQKPEITWINPAPEHVGDTIQISMIIDEIELQATPAGGLFTYVIPSDPDNDIPILDEEGNPTNIFHPSSLPLGNYQLIYSFQNENGCTNEERINIEIIKPYWSDDEPYGWDPNWFGDCTDAGKWEITNPHQMGSFIASVYGLNGMEKTDFSGVTIYLTNDIDLQEEPVFYRPFNDTAVFNGTFDGAAQIISNMVILEEDLQMSIMGTIRNVGFKDAKITNSTSETVIDVVETAQFHNCFITMPTLNNVTPNFEPTGEVRNVYYVGPKDGEDAVSVYWDNAAETPVYIEPVENEALLHRIVADEEPVTGILEEWVWMQNDFNYYTWKLDEDEINYGWPVFETSFEHHHYIVVDEYELGTHTFTGAQEREIDGETYTYAMNGDEVTITFTPEQYVIFDTIAIIAHDYRVAGVDLDIDYVYADNSFTFTMPLDSVYEPAYWVEIIPMPRRDYWTDEGNYDPDWYDNCAGSKFEITTSRQLAALAYEVDFGGHTFADTTIYIVGAIDDDPLRDNVSEHIVNMAGHMWRPIYNFQGTLDGTHFIVDSLYIRENYDESMYPYYNAMFVNLDGIIRNLGVQDIDLPEGSAIFRMDDGEYEEEMLAAAMAVNVEYQPRDGEDPTTGETNETEETMVEPGVYNSFVTVNPELHMQYEIAGPDIHVENTYTIDVNGNMIDGDHASIDFGQLREWVAEQNALAGSAELAVYWDWIIDEEPINYYYPIHDPDHVPGFNITYIPSQEDVDDEDNHGYVGGPTIGHEGETIIVDAYPDYCYNMTQLWLIDGNDTTDIKDTKKFVMPDHEVTVYGVFAPIEWTFTINYLDVNGDPVADPYTSTQIYNDSLSIESPAIEGLEPDMPVVDTVMPCDNLTVNVTYDGEWHQIFFCEGMYQDEEDEEGNLLWAEWIEEVIADDSARYTHEVTITIKPQNGLSLGNVTITNLTDKQPVEYTNPAGTYNFTFTMPLGDIEICAEATEEYWDGYGIADISWFVNNEDADTYILTTDSMLGGLAALVTGRDWLYDPSYEWLFDPEHGQYTEEEAMSFNFAGKTIIVQSEQEEGMIDLIEHKWRPIGAQVEFTHWFQGYFDGNGHKIVNMETADLSLINEEGNGSCQAFFGNVGANAVINDLDIQGIAQGRYFTAGIAGVNKGKIINSVSRVIVRSEFEAGGIVANNWGEIYNCYCMVDSIECWSAAPLRDDPNSNNNNYYVGGIAAYNTSIIDNCHSVARLVMGHGNNPIHYYGSLVGMNEGEVKNSFWTPNPIEDAIGGGDPAINCAVIGANTSSLLTANAQALSTEVGYTLFNWTDGTEGYPIFDREAKAIMSITNNELNANVYPNPTHGYVKVECEGMQRVMVFNMFGQLMLDNQVNDNMTELQLNGFAAGVYTVRIITANGMATRNVVVE